MVVAAGMRASRLRLSFVILTWNSVGTIDDCVGGAIRKCESEGIGYEVLVVDNGSTDGTKKLVERWTEQFPVHLIRFPRNVGTAVSRNAAFLKCRGTFVCVMDSDAILQEGRIEDMLAVLGDRSVGIAAPRLVLPNGTVQNSVKRHPSAWAKLLKVPRILLGLPFPDLDFYPDFPFEGRRDVETAIAACWFLRKDLLDRVGLLDERIFYPTEDIDYCLRVRKAGFRIVCAPRLSVLHHTQHLTHKRPLSRMGWLHLRYLAYYFWKHRYLSRPRFQDGACKSVPLPPLPYERQEGKHPSVQ